MIFELLWNFLYKVVNRNLDKKSVYFFFNYIRDLKLIWKFYNVGDLDFFSFVFCFL